MTRADSPEFQCELLSGMPRKWSGQAGTHARWPMPLAMYARPPKAYRIVTGIA
ncbi:MAG: hypothetical protein AVDCRST_MAG71-428 [uncultured Lysobacter sp.]|uniref:Uncharacterized protein n=1 Tax=uncultured Lysobacter sp. TaxID=271060 RepID=A0A6J4KJK1_9GAMM|nr:MAG: hypothetical protein AVDCRST_MAG71-428 [uncultured Lysobacter sp.]